MTIAVARDAAFSFIYRDNLQILQQMGAQYAFSRRFPIRCPKPMRYICPAVTLSFISINWRITKPCCTDSCAHVQADKPTVAECGGMLPSAQWAFTNKEGHRRDLLAYYPVKH